VSTRPPGILLALLCALVAGLAVAATATAAMTVSQTIPARTSATPVAHHPLYMPTLQNKDSAGVQPPPVELPAVCAPTPVNQCLPWQLPPAGQPTPVNLAYFGGHVQVTPKIYLILWGWGQHGAFNHAAAGQPANDPDGAAQRMIDFVQALGGTSWAGVQKQFYQLVNGAAQHITNPGGQLGGVWRDDTNAVHNNLSAEEIAQEAARGAAHFTGASQFSGDYANANFVVATPQNFNEAGFNQSLYCAWHDYTQPANYPGVPSDMSFTNMPYVSNAGSGCGADAVNPPPAGSLDGFTIALGHEIEETVTDPGAEVVANGQNLGGWYDYGAYENGDKCAYVGDTAGAAGVSGGPPASTVPGGLNDITGNDGKQYAVQSLWSNQAAGGLGYCAGAGDDLPAG
jgi:hypothetical protein